MSDTFYLIDFENVHGEGIKYIKTLPKNNCVHLFYTGTNSKVDVELISSMEADIQCHQVHEGKQSLDMHLLSYLGYLIGVKGKTCTYIIVSKDTDYDNIIKFWKKEGFLRIMRKAEIPNQLTVQKSNTEPILIQTANNKIKTNLSCDFKGSDRSELNEFMQHELVNKGYSRDITNKICKCVISHCNDENMLKEIHNELQKQRINGLEVYEDVKQILSKFAALKGTNAKKRKLQINSFLGQHFKEKIYTDKKEEILNLILEAKTKQQINNGLMKIYSDGKVVKHIYKAIQPLIKELPGK